MSQTLLKIDSSLRLNPLTTFPSDCIIPCNDTLSGLYSVRSIMVPVTYHNVNDGNNTVYWTDTGGARTATLAKGYYSSFASLADELASVMTTGGAGTVTTFIDPRTNILTVYNTVSFSFSFGSHAVNSAAVLIGFIGDSVDSLVSQTGQRIMNLRETLSFNFSIADCTAGVRTTNGQGYTFSLPCLTSTPGLSYREPSEHFPITFRISATKSLGVRIHDDQSKILNNMMSDWIMMLERISN